MKESILIVLVSKLTVHVQISWYPGVLIVVIQGSIWINYGIP